ncbi:MAG TPA: hypothetical protein VJ841_04455 [Candidatus Saccharimonadales bacterium]|nr:hypothetical protein [Candidatus Saccharimonadales bacterium]
MAQNAKTQIRKTLEQGNVTGGDHASLMRQFKLTGVSRKQLERALAELKDSRVISISFDPKTQRRTYRLR